MVLLAGCYKNVYVLWQFDLWRWGFKSRFLRLWCRGDVLSPKRGEQPGLICLLAVAASVLALGRFRVCWNLVTGSNHKGSFYSIKCISCFSLGLSDMFWTSLCGLWFFDVITYLLKLQPQIVLALQITLKPYKLTVCLQDLLHLPHS